MSAKRIFGSCLVLLGASLLPLMGCGGGVECGPGTVEEDGECVLEGDLDCPDGQVRLGSSCVDTASLCDTGTTYDADSGTCVADGEAGFTCGPNTSEDGGVCIVDTAAVCSTGTQRDPMENVCVVTEAVCSGATAYDSDTDTCLPTADVCDDGTEFDAELGLCMATVGCQSGDVVVDGFCLSPAQAMAADADVDADGANSSPFFEGTPHAINPDGGAVFTGTIVAPTDLDDDGNLDQHFDYFAFEAEAGDWFEISVQSLGLPAPHFAVWYQYEEDDGEGGVNLETVLYRESSTFSGNAKAREVVIPRDSLVIVEVGPEAAFLQATPVGGEGWDYVGSVTALDTPTPASHNFEDDGNIAGTLGLLSDNFFVIDEFEEGANVIISYAETPGDTTLLVQAWASPTEYIGQWNSSFSLQVPADGFFLVADWYTTNGPDLAYELEATEQQTLEPGVDLEVVVTAEQHDVLEVQQSNDGTTGVWIYITDESGNDVLGTSEDPVLLSEIGQGVSSRIRRLVGVDAGEYTVTFVGPEEDAIEGFVPMVSLVSPTVIDEIPHSSAGSGDDAIDGEQSFYLLELDEESLLRFSLTKEASSPSSFAELSLEVYEGGEEIARIPTFSEMGGTRNLDFDAEADTAYILRVGDNWTGGGLYEFDYSLEIDEIVAIAEMPFTVNSRLDRVRISQSNPEGISLGIRVEDEDQNQVDSRLLSSGFSFDLTGLSAGNYTVFAFGIEGSADPTLEVEQADIIFEDDFSLVGDNFATITQIDGEETVWVGITDASGNVVVNQALTTFGSITVTGEGTYDVEVRSFSLDTMDLDIDVTEVGELGSEEFTVLDGVAEVSIAQSNAESASVNVVVTDENGRVVASSSSLSSTGSLDFFVLAGTYTVTASGPLEIGAVTLEETITAVDVTEVTTVSVDDHDVIEVTQTNDDSSSVTFVITGDAGLVSSATLANFGSFGLQRQRAINLAAGSYTIWEVGDELTDGLDATVEVVSPTLVSEVPTTSTGESHELLSQPQAYYLVLLDETTTANATFTKGPGAGWGRLTIYGEGNQQLQESANMTSVGASTTLTQTFEADQGYVLRVGGNSTSAPNATTLGWTFDYTLEIE